jgi:alpha-L-fucosidase 2
MGLTAAVSEMLVQSHDGAVELLPALPKSWSSGHFEGVRVRGGFQLSLKWNAGKVSELKVIADQAGEFRLRTGGNELFLNNRKIKSNGTGTAVIKMKKGEEQMILFR